LNENRWVINNLTNEQGYNNIRNQIIIKQKIQFPQVEKDVYPVDIEKEKVKNILNKK
jgi:hypothetical protein